jgi:hypothetical protein
VVELIATRGREGACVPSGPLPNGDIGLSLVGVMVFAGALRRAHAEAGSDALR